MCFYSPLCTVGQLVHYTRSIFTGCFYPLQSPNTAKKMERGRSSSDSSVFMLNGIRNDFLNATLCALPYCKNSVNEFNVQLLAGDVHFSSLADQHVGVIYSSSGSLAWFVMFPSCASSASHTLFTFFLNALCCWRNFCISVATWRHVICRAPDCWLTECEPSWHLRSEMRDLCSQHIPCFYDTTQHLPSKEVFFLLKLVLKAFSMSDFKFRGFFSLCFLCLLCVIILNLCLSTLQCLGCLLFIHKAFGALHLHPV